jgi:hypothetical protein
MTIVAIPPSTRNRFGVSLPILLGVLVYTKIILSGGAVIHDADPYWHIAVGRWIIAHYSVPTHDVFSFSMAEAPWDPPEWLAEIVMAWLFDNFGWAGLVVATGLSVTAAVMLLLRVLLRTLPPVIAMIGAVLAWGTSLSFAVARPHIFALPILVAWVAGLVTARSQDRAPSWRLALLMTLWANLHPSYILGLGLTALLAGEAILLAPDWDSRVRTGRAWGFFCTLSIAAALITPFGINGLLLPFKLTDMSFTSAILTEWQSPNFQRFDPLELWLMLVLFAGLSLGWRLPPTRVGIVLLLLHMALEHARYAELLGFVGPLVVAPTLAPQLRVRSGDSLATSIDRGMATLAKPANAVGIALACAVLLAISAAGLRGPSIRPAVATPEEALAVAAAHGVEGPVLNDFGFGGYLIFRNIKPFIDGRYLPYGDALMNRFVEAMQDPTAQLPPLLSAYRITWTLLSPKWPAVLLLDHLPGWRRLYADDIAVVHVRDDQLAR